MSDLYKNQYRVESTRLVGWDYSWPGYYFVTICTKNREMFFGHVAGDRMILNNAGRTVADEWMKTPQIRKNVKLGELIIMPNHLHGIIIIDNGEYNLFKGINEFFKNKHPCVETPRRDTRLILNNPSNPNNMHIHELLAWGVSALNTTTHETPHTEQQCTRLSLSDRGLPHTIHQPRRGVSTLKSNSLGIIINQFKTNCTKKIQTINPYFNWQPRFYDRIIRNEEELHNARYYIISNPEKWYRDRNNREGLGM